MKRLRAFLVGAVLVAVFGTALGACGTDAQPTPAPSGSTASSAGQAAAASQPAAAPAPSQPAPSPRPAEPTATATPEPAPSETPEPALSATPPPALTPEPASDPTPTPTPTVAIDTPTPSAPDAATQAASDALVSELTERSLATLVALVEDLSPRASATDEELVAARHLQAEFQELGYRVELQPFTVDVLSEERPMLSLTSPDEGEIGAFPLRLTGHGQIEGVLADAGGAFVDDIPAEGLSGKIAVIERGTITFEEKITRVADAGAVAAVVYNDQPGLFGGTLQTRASIPAIAIAREDGLAIKAMIGEGTVEASVFVVRETRDSRNVIVEKPGLDGDGHVVILGAHYDTVPATQGANDNG